MIESNLLNSRLPQLWHGGDYSPEQWPSKVWDEDMRLMQESRYHVATIGVFSWAILEPTEGFFDFRWLDEIIAKLTDADRYFILATPSAAQPAWLSHKFPEVLRTGADRIRRQHGNRVNYNYNSPIYRHKVQTIARLLAKRYGNHPRLLAWHVSNEFGGEDFGPESIAAFRAWLKKKYKNLDALNAAYWTAFWGHTYYDWEEIDAPGHPYGETAVQGLSVDWMRFTTDSTLEFMLHEAAPLRELSPNVPITTNFMGTYGGLDYRKFTPHIDFACWDSYPAFGGELADTDTWVTVAFKHDLTRCLMPSRRWMLMECTPSSSNWYPSMALKRPGVHHFEALQAVAHGADGVQYFQWRQSRGSQEQFHGAVVNHGTTNNGRVFNEVREVGEHLDQLADVVGSKVVADVAIVFDWSARWALNAACGPVQGEKGYEKTCLDHYRVFWNAGISVDVVGPEDDLSGYRLVIAPMAYAVTTEFTTKVESYVNAGGTFVTTYLSAWTDENSLIFENGFLGPWQSLLGIWSEELDAMPRGAQNRVSVNGLGIEGSFAVEKFCELIHLTTAEQLGVYEDDFYAGRPAVTVNQFGEGKAYYVASRNEGGFTAAFLQALIHETGIQAPVRDLPEGVTVQVRQDDGKKWFFFLNASPSPQTVPTEEWGDLDLGPWGVSVQVSKR